MYKQFKIEYYRESRSCPKCGNDHVTTNFDGKGDYPTGNMIRKCERCGHWWYERPLDAETDED